MCLCQLGGACACVSAAVTINIQGTFDYLTVLTLQNDYFATARGIEVGR
jgi:hypothetical protein